MAKKILHGDIVESDIDQKLEAVFRSAKEKVNKELDSMVADIKTKQKEISGFLIDSNAIKTQSELTDSIKRVKVAKQELSRIEKERLKVQQQSQAQLSKNLTLNEKQRSILEKGKQAYAERLRLLKEDIAINRQLPGSINRINLELKKNIKNYRALSAEQRKNSQVGNKLLSTIKQQQKELRQLQKPLQNARSSFSNLVSSLKAYAAAYLGIAGLSRLVKNLFETTKAFDTLDRSMKFVIQDSNELAVTQQFLISIAGRYGGELLSLTQSFIRFRATTKNTNITFKQTRDIFESVTKTAAALGLSSQRIELALLALEQMASKGTVSMEELRRQLGDQIPGAVPIMARALGVGINELYEMIKANKVLAEDALPKFVKEMEKSFGIESVDSVENMTVAVSKLKTEWQLFVKSINAAETSSKVINTLIKSFKLLRGITSRPFDLEYEDQFYLAERAVDGFIETLSDKGAAQSIEEIETKIKELNEELKATGYLTGDVTDFMGKGNNPKEAKAAMKNAAMLKNKIELLETSLIEYTKLLDAEVEETGILNDLNETLKDLNSQRLSATRAIDIDRIDIEIEKIEKQIQSYETLKNIKEALKEGTKEAEKIYKQFNKTLEEESDIIDDVVKAEEKSANRNANVINKDKIKAEKEYINLVQDLYKRLGKYKEAYYEEDLAILRGKYEEQLQVQRNYFNAGTISEQEYLNNVKNIERNFLNDRITLWFQNNIQLINNINSVAQEIANALLAINAIAIQNAQAAIEAHQTQISKLESSLSEEKRLRDEGANNDVERVRAQIEKEKKLRNEAVEELKKAKKREAGIQLAAQASSIITASSNIMAHWSLLGPFGWVAGLAQIAAMIAAFASYKAKINAANREVPQYAEGTEYVKGEGTETSDSIPAMLSKGERVVPADINKKLKGIPNDTLGELADIYRLNLPSMNQNYELTGWSILANEMKEGKEATKALLAFHEENGRVIDTNDAIYVIGKNKTKIFHKSK